MPRLSRTQWIVLGFVAFLGLGAWLGISRLDTPYAIEREDQMALSKVVTATFGKASALKVGTLSGTVQATAADARLGGLLQSDSVMRAPYSVDFLIDLSQLTLADYQWDAGSRVLTIRAPEPVATAPNIDEAKMEVKRRGIYITRDAFDAMSRTASTHAARIASDRANSPEMKDKARENARAVLSRLLKGPLEATGLRKVTVAVRFPGDGTETSNERWDASRSLEQVLNGQH